MDRPGKGYSKGHSNTEDMQEMGPQRDSHGGDRNTNEAINRTGTV